MMDAPDRIRPSDQGPIPPLDRQSNGTLAIPDGMIEVLGWNASLVWGLLDNVVAIYGRPLYADEVVFDVWPDMTQMAAEGLRSLTDQQLVAVDRAGYLYLVRPEVWRD